jgi:hypothetical protein
MMKTGLIGSLIAAILFLNLQPVGAASDPGGVFGLKWSQSDRDCRKAGVCQDETLPVKDLLKDETVYYGTQESLAGLPLQFASVGFYKGKLYRAVMMFKPEEKAFDQALRDLSVRHGKPEKQNARSAVWSLGSTRITLARGEKTCGVMYAHEPTYAACAKLKGSPYYQPPPPPPAKRTKKK